MAIRITFSTKTKTTPITQQNTNTSVPTENKQQAYAHQPADATTKLRNPLPSQETEITKIPTIKKGTFGPSIKRSFTEPEQSMATKNTIGQTTSDKNTAFEKRTDFDDEDYLVTEKDICFYWHEFANLLPQEESYSCSHPSKRILNIRFHPDIPR